MNFNIISTYRTQLMGIAILSIMFFHSTIDTRFSPILGLIKGSGYGGVDIFMFLSGFGICYSLNKKPNIRDFIKSRLLRILPYYIPIAIIYGIYMCSQGNWSVTQAIANSTLTSYWLKLLIQDWYIHVTVVLYILSPLFFHFFQKKPILSSFIVIILSYLFCFLVINTQLSYLLLFAARIPIYILGFLVARYNLKNKEKQFKKKHIILLAISLILGYSILGYLHNTLPMNICTDHGFVIYPFLLIVIPFCLFWSYVFSLTPKYKYPILSFFGAYTLTLYLFHERTLHILEEFTPSSYPNMLAFIITILLAVGWQKLVEKPVQRIFY